MQLVTYSLNFIKLYFNKVVKLKARVASYENFLKISVYHISIKFRNIYKNINILDFLNYVIEYNFYSKFSNFYVLCLILG